MFENFESFFSANSKNMKRSVIRELLKITQKPEIISFAGGLPASNTFPVQDLKEASDKVFDKYSASALQYGATEGDESLKEELVKFEGREGLEVTTDNILIVSASQQALDMVGKIFIDPGDIIIAGKPTYVGALGSFNAYRADIRGVPFSPEDDGMDMEALEATLEKATKEGRAKFIYVIPDFQNPAGFCWSLEKRKKLLELAYKYKILIIEDSPYREIRFVGEHIPSLYSLDTEGIVIGLKTFSKILVPGTRLGWILAHKDMIQKFVIAKQSMDLCTNTLGQKMMAEYLKTGKLEGQIQGTITKYKIKRELMLERLEAEMPKHPGVKWTKPEGGLFLWLSLPKEIDTDELFYKAVEENVAYVIGSAFYAKDPEKNSMRINFSYSSEEQIKEGVVRLAKVIKREMEEKGLLK